VWLTPRRGGCRARERSFAQRQAGRLQQRYVKNLQATDVGKPISRLKHDVVMAMPRLLRRHLSQTKKRRTNVLA
jgi:hypothetical protein